MRRGKYIRTKEIRERLIGNKYALGHKLSEEAREKISLSQKGRITGGMLGKHHKLETKQKMSLSHKGIKNPFYGKHLSEEHKRHLSEALKGIHLSEETKRKIGLAHRGKKRGKFSEKWKKNIAKSRTGRFNGDKAPNWLGGKSFEPYNSEFNKELKELIRKRDNYICQKCGKEQNGRTHSVHHIDYDKKNLNPLNLITLCISCNGKVNANRNYWKEYFTNFLHSRITE